MPVDNLEMNKYRFRMDIPNTKRFSTLTKLRAEAYKYAKRYPHMTIALLENEKSTKTVLKVHWSRVGYVTGHENPDYVEYVGIEEDGNDYKLKYYLLNKNGTLGRRIDVNKPYKRKRK